MTSTGTALSGITDRKWKTVTYNWTITNCEFFEPNASEAVVYSEPFETDHNVSWQAAFAQRNSSKFAQFGLKFLGCSVFGPFYPMTVELICKAMKGGVTVLQPKRLVFDSKSSEQLVYSTMTLEEMFKYVGVNRQKLRITYYITTRQLESFIIPRNNLLLPKLDLDRKNSELTNVVLVAFNGASVTAHKELLAAQSTVFAAMFNTNMVEKQRNQVKINDMGFEVLSELMTFIYTGKAKLDLHGPVTAASLLAVAEKYDLGRLKAACEHAVFKQMDLSKTIDTLLLADQYNAQQLKTHILQFIKHNLDDVIKTVGWKTLIAKHPKLLLEVHQAMASK